MMKKKVSFVIAVYCNEHAVSETYRIIAELFAGTLSAYDLEIVFVDDGSKDGSLAEIVGIHERDPRAKVLSFTRNFGQMAAILAGLKQASGDAVINISADLQDPIELIAQMIERWESGSDTVICYRTERDDRLSTRFTSKIAYGLLRLSIPQIPPGGFDFVLLSRRAVDTFNSVDLRNRFFQGDLLWAGYPTALIPYVRRKRTIGRSQYTFWKRLKNFADALLDASYLPIRAISVAGVTMSMAGFLYAATVVGSWLFHATPFPGWAPIMIAISIIGGLNMVMLGVVGEYVWRIYDEVRGKPNYVIRDTHL